MKPKPLPPLKRLQEYLQYDPETGGIVWIKRKHRGPLPGERAGTLEDNGYIRVQFDGRHYPVHRIAWYFMTGEDPLDFEIDHIDRDETNNRWLNLRLATDSDNQKNQAKPKSNTSGVKGVSWHKKKGLWIAHIGLNKKLHHLGYFRLLEHAEEAVREYREQLHKEFTHHG